MKRKTIIVLAAIVVGLGYGGVSAYQNRNPYYPIPGQNNVPQADMAEAWHWEPSPVWLPSYLLCKVAKHSEGNWAGVTCTRSGYLFRNTSDLWIYSIASTILGGVTGMLVGFLVNRVLKGSQARSGRAR
ncbi:MAG: hypothetical protein ACYS21_13995 [Planctomycetota bacterium]|jgi:hypothetical protein